MLADDVEVGPLCYVGPNVTIGAGTRLISHVSILGRTTLGCDNTVWPQAVLGGTPQDLKYRGEDSQLIIGDHNEFRETVTIHRGTDADHGKTMVGNDNLIMVGCHIAHDCVIGDHVIMANIAQLAGHVKIENHARLAGACAIHHFVTVGQYAFVGGMTRITNDVPPFMIVEGNPSKVRGPNTILLERNAFPAQTVTALRDAFKKLFRTHNNEPGLNMAAHLDGLIEQYPDDACIHQLVGFIRNKMVGLHGRYRENLRHDDRRDNPNQFQPTSPH